MNQYNNNKTQSSIEKSSIAVIDTAIGTLSTLVNNLQAYKECIVDFYRLQSTGADIDTIYSFGTYPQSHTLPGVTSTPQAYHNQCDENMERINENKEKILRHKRIYFRFIEQDSRLYFQSLKGLKNMDAHFEEFIEILNGNIDLSLQPQKLNDRHRTKPSIKLSVDQKF